MNDLLFRFIKACPTPYHTVDHVSKILESEGYVRLFENEKWNIEPGIGYYVTRNGSSLISFRIPDGDISGFMMTASHSDSPCFKIKENAELTDRNYVRLAVEGYGGMLCSTWMDRPLSVAGRASIMTPFGIEMKLVDFERASAVIPNLAIHMNRKANDGTVYNNAVDMLPLYGGASSSGLFKSRVAAVCSVDEDDILTTDLFLYNPDDGIEWGDFISAPRLDDLQCAFAALTAFIKSKESDSVPVYCLFDNEEVGSHTKQGAASTFLTDVMARISESLGYGDEERRMMIANSFLISCDNAHAIHPNHPETADRNHSVYMNGGIVIKYNANQKYTTDALSAAIVKTVCEEAKVPYQSYANRADMPGGSTLGKYS